MTNLEHTDAGPVPVYDAEAGWEPSELDHLDVPPVEVFEAIDGNPSKLISYLRSGEPLSLYTIEAIAACLAKELPPKRKPGRPHGSPQDRRMNAGGLAMAAYLVKQRYAEAGRPSGQKGEIVDQVAEERGIDPEKLHIYLRKSTAQRPTAPQLLPLLEEMWWEWKTQR
jgi:hypothetical protein